MLATTTPVKFRVDNNPCRGVLAAPKVGANMADACGILRYASPTDTVTMGFTASHPNNFADYSFGSDSRSQQSAASGHRRGNQWPGERGHQPRNDYGYRRGSPWSLCYRRHGSVCRIALCRGKGQQRLVAPIPVRRFGSPGVYIGSARSGTVGERRIECGRLTRGSGTCLGLSRCTHCASFCIHTARQSDKINIQVTSREEESRSRSINHLDFHYRMNFPSCRAPRLMKSVSTEPLNRRTYVCAGVVCVVPQR